MSAERRGEEGESWSWSWSWRVGGEGGGCNLTCHVSGRCFCGHFTIDIRIFNLRFVVYVFNTCVRSRLHNQITVSKKLGSVLATSGLVISRLPPPLLPYYSHLCLT